jgi:hypothetical protein
MEASMTALRWLLATTTCVVVSFAACATGDTTTADDDDDGGGGSAGATSAGGATTTTPTDSGGMGNTGGQEVVCDPPTHKCGGVCAQNTPQTGCYASVTCEPCPQVANGSSTCTADGLCDFECVPPYIKETSSCACPTECCGPTDCTGGAVCDQGVCVMPCEDSACAFCCMFNCMQAGDCNGLACECFPLPCAQCQ